MEISSKNNINIKNINIRKTRIIKIKLYKFKNKKDSDNLKDIKEIKQGTKEYPQQLNDLKNPPQILYAQGNLKLLKTNRNICNRNKKSNRIWNKNG